MSVYFTKEIITNFITGQHIYNIPYTTDEDGNVYLITGEKCYEIGFENMKNIQKYQDKLQHNEYFMTETSNFL